MRHEVTTRRVLYEIPGMQSVRVEKSTFPGANGEPLPLETYQPINPIATGIAPQISPHGVKIEEMNNTVTASALTNGQTVGSGSSWMLSGAASCNRVTSSARMRVGSPTTHVSIPVRSG